MAQLLYSMITSLDGYAVAAEGDLGRGAEDPEVHTFIGDLFRPVGVRLDLDLVDQRRFDSGLLYARYLPR
ncbi:hypothetical protein [Pseudonocardia oceani]|uniref:hypothetical protein n=1 Tax=Pseudonocardia oceani TaxID=2792013 RepID=UPI001CEDC966|nr:hypothetical protein [Pseudonocardia oceani]